MDGKGLNCFEKASFVLATYLVRYGRMSLYLFIMLVDSWELLLSNMDIKIYNNNPKFQ